MRLTALLLACLALPALAADVDRSRDEHSWAEPDKVVIRDLGLDLRVDFAKKELRGSADLALDWKDPAHRRLVLDTRDLAIDKVLGKVIEHDGATSASARAADTEVAPSTFQDALRAALKELSRA